MSESVDVVVIESIERNPGPPYQGYGKRIGLDDEAVITMFRAKYGYPPAEVLWDAIVKAGPILEPIGGGGG